MIAWRKSGQGLEKKLDSLVQHELYGKYKTALTQEEQGKSQTGISGQTRSAGQFPLVVFLDENRQGRVTPLW